MTSIRHVEPWSKIKLSGDSLRVRHTASGDIIKTVTNKCRYPITFHSCQQRQQQQQQQQQQEEEEEEEEEEQQQQQQQQQHLCPQLLDCTAAHPKLTKASKNFPSSCVSAAYAINFQGIYPAVYLSIILQSSVNMFANMSMNINV